MAYPKGCQWAEKIGAGRGLGGEKGAHLDRAEAAEGDQQQRACIGASAISGTAISADRQADLACHWLYANQAADVGSLGVRRWTGRWRAQIEGRWGRMTCPPAGTDSDGVKAICVARAARQAGHSVRGARGTARGARGTAQSTPRAGKTLIALMWTRRRRRLGGERRLVGEPVYRVWIDGRDD